MIKLFYGRDEKVSIGLLLAELSFLKSMGVNHVAMTLGSSNCDAEMDYVELIPTMDYPTSNGAENRDIT